MTSTKKTAPKTAQNSATAYEKLVSAVPHWGLGTLSPDGDMASFARFLMRVIDRGILSSCLPTHKIERKDAQTPENWPYGSFVLVASDGGGQPLCLLSDLAEHSQALSQRPEVSLTFAGNHALAAPMAGPRVTVLGRMTAVTDPVALEAGRKRYQNRHPSTALFADFADFRLYRLEILRGHLIAGFGQARWLSPDKLCAPMPEKGAWAEEEAVLLQEIEALYGPALYDSLAAESPFAAQIRAALAPETPWRLTGVDCEGLDVRAGGQTARLSFLRPARTRQDLAQNLSALCSKKEIFPEDEQDSDG